MDDLSLARHAAFLAAAEIAARFGTLDHADFKGIVDPVTEADRAAEEVIVSILADNRPDDGILAEEGGAADSASGRRWVVDPLDGTVNFVHGFPQVAVSIGLEDDSGPLVAVIRDAIRNDEFTAIRGEGAFLDGEPMRVSGRTELGRSLVSTGFAYDRQQRAGEYLAVVDAVMRRARGIRRGGSAALDLAWVACGRLDAHWEFNLAPWDVAAGRLLVTEAGGTVTASDGGPATHHDIVASNGGVHEELRTVVEGAVRGTELGGP